MKTSRILSKTRGKLSNECKKIGNLKREKIMRKLMEWKEMDQLEAKIETGRHGLKITMDKDLIVL